MNRHLLLMQFLGTRSGMWALVGVAAVIFIIVTILRAVIHRKMADSVLIGLYVVIAIGFGLLSTIANRDMWDYTDVTHWVMGGTQTSGPFENFFFSIFAEALIIGGLGAAIGALLSFIGKKIAAPFRRHKPETEDQEASPS